MAKSTFKRERVCSSDNYKLSKRLHIEYVIEKHKEFEKSTLKITLDSKKLPFVKCYGRLILLREEELQFVNPKDIIWM